MIRVFLDASVLFAAAYSKTGASREIIRQAIRNRVRVVVSPLVFEEAKRNLEAKAPEALVDLENFRRTVDFEVVRPTEKEVREAMGYTAAKDAPLIAAARKAGVDCLLSFDKEHLVEVPEVARGSGLTIILPGDFLRGERERAAR